MATIMPKTASKGGTALAIAAPGNDLCSNGRHSECEEKTVSCCFRPTLDAEGEFLLGLGACFRIACGRGSEHHPSKAESRLVIREAGCLGQHAADLLGAFVPDAVDGGENLVLARVIVRDAIGR